MKLRIAQTLETCDQLRNSQHIKGKTYIRKTQSKTEIHARREDAKLAKELVNDCSK
jgi:hypothetical protein